MGEEGSWRAAGGGERRGETMRTVREGGRGLLGGGRAEEGSFTCMLIVASASSAGRGASAMSTSRAAGAEPATVGEEASATGSPAIDSTAAASCASSAARFDAATSSRCLLYDARACSVSSRKCSAWTRCSRKRGRAVSCQGFFSRAKEEREEGGRGAP